MDRGVSPSLSSSTPGGIVTLLHNALTRFSCRTFSHPRHRTRHVHLEDKRRLCKKMDVLCLKHLEISGNVLMMMMMMTMMKAI